MFFNFLPSPYIQIIPIIPGPDKMVILYEGFLILSEPKLTFFFPEFTIILVATFHFLLHIFINLC